MLKTLFSAPKVTEVSPELQCVVDAALYRLVQEVFEGALKMTPIPCNREIAERLRVTVGDEAVRIWEEFVDELGF
jgi:hypothetical protein